MGDAYPHATGDWIVHSRYGLGQIIGLETKSISGAETNYFKIKGAESTFWVPVDQIGGNDLRALATSAEIQQVIATLQQPPIEMSDNHKLRQKRIQTVWTQNTLTATAKILRDLWDLRRRKGPLNQTERAAFRTLKQRLVTEWALITDTEAEEVTTQLEHLLD